MPVDTFFASGNFGQRVVVIPSQRLVIVRLGETMDPPDFDIQGLKRLVVEVIAAVGKRGRQSVQHPGEFGEDPLE